MLERFNDSLESKMNLFYIAAQGLYWMMVCCTISMGSAYLSNRGYSTFSIGVLFAIAYLIAAVLQQVISVATDNAVNFNVLDVLAILGLVISLNLFIACFTKGNSFFTGFTFLIGAMLATVIQPFLNALNFHIEKYNVSMNYGVARASGSFCFFIMSLLVGLFMKMISEKAAPFLGLLVSVGFTVVIVLIFKELKKTGISVAIEYDPFEEGAAAAFDSNYLKSFIEKYKMFFVFLIGLVCFYFGHVVINNFLYQIAVNVGGDEAANGGLLAVQAIVELPAMIFFTKLRDRFGTRLLLGTSAVFYFVKIFFTTIATSVAMLYFSMIFQALAFAVFIPASVHFVDEIMSKNDAVKGQAFVTIAMTFSSLIGSVLGGLLINIFDIKFTLWFSAIVTLLGVIIAIYGLFRINIQKS